jgi:hypothetical protein
LYLLLGLVVIFLGILFVHLLLDSKRKKQQNIIVPDNSSSKKQKEVKPDLESIIGNNAQAQSTQQVTLEQLRQELNIQKSIDQVKKTPAHNFVPLEETQIGVRVAKQPLNIPDNLFRQDTTPVRGSAAIPYKMIKHQYVKACTIF